MISANIFHKIERFLKPNRNIVAAYLFGSVATARERPHSDIDLALMIRGSIGGFERVELETALSNLLGKDVDLVIFSQASPLLQHQILKYGRILYESDTGERVRQEVEARWQYLDSQFLYKLIEEDESHGG